MYFVIPTSTNNRNCLQASQSLKKYLAQTKNGEGSDFFNKSTYNFIKISLVNMIYYLHIWVIWKHCYYSVDISKISNVCHFHVKQDCQSSYLGIFRHFLIKYDWTMQDIYCKLQLKTNQETPNAIYVLRIWMKRLKTHLTLFHTDNHTFIICLATCHFFGVNWVSNIIW